MRPSHTHWSDYETISREQCPNYEREINTHRLSDQRWLLVRRLRYVVNGVALTQRLIRYHPDAISDEGHLLIVDIGTQVLVEASDRSGDIFGVDIREYLGHSITSVVSAEILVHLDQLLRATDRPHLPIEVDARLFNCARTHLAFVHTACYETGPGTALVIEFIRRDPPLNQNRERLRREALTIAARAASVSETLRTITESTRTISGYDRVWITRFDDEDVEAIVVEEVGNAGTMQLVNGRFKPDRHRARARHGKDSAPYLYLQSTSDEGTAVVSLPGRPRVRLDQVRLRLPNQEMVQVLDELRIRSYFSVWIRNESTVWGVLALAHYSRDKPIPPGDREFFATLAAIAADRIIVLERNDVQNRITQAFTAFATLKSRLLSASADDIGLALADSQSALTVMGADGLIVSLHGQVATAGLTPDSLGVEALLEWAQAGSEQAIHHTDSFSTTLQPGTAALLRPLSGALAVCLPDGQTIIWLRRARAFAKKWINRAHSGTLSADGPTGVRDEDYSILHEDVTDRTEPWTEDHRTTALQVRTAVLEALHARDRRTIAETERLQRSLLPESLVARDGWNINASCLPAGLGQVGGDWYDSLDLGSGRVAFSIGDVTGHGLSAAAAMAHLRISLRACLHREPNLAVAVADFQRICVSMADVVATVLLVVMDFEQGTIECANWGHPPILVAHPQFGSSWVAGAETPPVGFAHTPPQIVTVALRPDDCLILFTDGLVERRGESLRVGLQRLSDYADAAQVIEVEDVVRSVRDPLSKDDATILVISPVHEMQEASR